MIRAVRKTDAAAIAEIYAPYVLETAVTFEYQAPDEAEFARRIERITKQFPWLVWEEEGEILGYAYADAPFSRPAYAWCAELSIYLRRDIRGRGIGSALYRELEAILEKQGYQILYAIVTGDNQASMDFHRARGYTIRANFPGCAYKFQKSLGIVWMEKRLKPVEIPDNFPTNWMSIVRDD